MLWLYAGLACAVVSPLVVWALPAASGLRAFAGSVALIAAALAPVVAVLRRRREWVGTQLVFWTAIAAGAGLWAAGQVGWMVHEVWLRQELPWLQWYAVLNLVGSAMPLFALLARPHRGPRRADGPIIAIDIAGLLTLGAYLYLAIVIGPGIVGGQQSGMPLLLLRWSQAQRLLLLAAMIAMAVQSRGTAWGPTFRKLSLAAAIGLAGRTALNVAVARGAYYTGSVYDVAWTLPFFLYAWAAASAPASPATDEGEIDLALSPPPWLIFAIVAMVPLTDLGIDRASPMGPRIEAFRDAISSVSEFVLLALLTLRIAVERSARRRTSARLRLMAAAVRETDDLTLILRASGRFEYANAAFCRALGYTERELSRTPPETLVDSASRAAFFDIARHARDGGVARGSLTRVRKDGTTFPTSATVVPIFNPRGELTHLVGLERDITEELRMRDQMIHAERLSAVGQLVSGVAHEINNPLQTVVGFTEIMLAGEQRADVRKDLERIFTEANRAGKIVRNLLSFVRRSSHARRVDDLNDIVQSTVSLRAYELRIAGIELVETYDAAVPPVFVNREEVQQVVLNLILNAEHAMLEAHGRGRLTITTGRRDRMLFVEIEDDGPGVPAHIAGQMFEPFFTTKEVGKGTGLGLSIAMGIAASHGGRLEYMPAAVRGARFRLTLPPAEATAGDVASARGEPAVTLPSPGRMALVADDEPAVRDLVARLLERRGYLVDIAADGATAVALIEKSEYDLVMCDVKMPHLGGAGVFDRLQAIAPDLRDRFVFITGDMVTDDVGELAAAHGIPLLSKPFTSADLDAVLGAIDAEHQGSDPSFAAARRGHGA